MVWLLLSLLRWCWWWRCGSSRGGGGGACMNGWMNRWMDVCSFVCMSELMYACMHLCTFHKYIHTYIHTHARTHTHIAVVSVAPVCHRHGGGCGVRSQTCRSGDSAGMGRHRDCRDHQPTPFFFPGPPRSVCGVSPQNNVSVACLVRARHPVLS